MPDPSLPTTIIPRLPNESARAHAAKVAYVTMGPDRSLEKARQKSGKKAAYVRQLEEWSSQHDWQATARAWDDQQAALVAQQASAQYLADLEDHRQRYQQFGKDLFQLARGLMGQCAIALRGRTIIDKDGKEWHIPAMEMTPTAIAMAMRAGLAAADLEAHALRLADLLPTLSHDDDL